MYIENRVRETSTHTTDPDPQRRIDMHGTFIVLAVLAAVASSGGGLMLDRPLYIPGTDDLLQYDDGTANWLTWGGLYRGVWFDIDDFSPGGSAELDNLEYWFFHHASYPWDTASFYSELYTGDASAPATMLNQTSVTAVHYQPVYASYASPIDVGNEFWGLVNTEMSAGGWPSILGDNTPQTVDHSFFSDDFIVWEPWVIQGPTANDYFVRANCPVVGLQIETWAGIKYLWQ
jgi:hypothetical protein